MTLAATMYALMAGSPKTTTTADITDTDVQVYLSDLSILPAAPNVLIMYTSPTVWERCPYSLKQSASGAGYVTIARSGTNWASSTGLAQAFATGTKVARNVFKSDFDAIQANITGHETRLATAESGLSTAQGDITSLDGRLDDVESDITDLQAATGGMNPIVAALIFG